MGKSTINNIYERDEFGLKNSLCESGIFCLEAALGGDDYGTYAAMASSLKVRRPGWGHWGRGSGSTNAPEIFCRFTTFGCNKTQQFMWQVAPADPVGP